MNDVELTALTAGCGANELTSGRDILVEDARQRGASPVTHLYPLLIPGSAQEIRSAQFQRLGDRIRERLPYGRIP